MYLGATTEKEKEMKARRNNQTQLNTKVKAIINNIVKQLHMLATSSYQKSYSELINDQSKDISIL